MFMSIIDRFFKKRRERIERKRDYLYPLVAIYPFFSNLIATRSTYVKQREELANLIKATCECTEMEDK